MDKNNTPGCLWQYGGDFSVAPRCWRLERFQHCMVPAFSPTWCFTCEQTPRGAVPADPLLNYLLSIDASSGQKPPSATQSWRTCGAQSGTSITQQTIHPHLLLYWLAFRVEGEAASDSPLEEKPLSSASCRFDRPLPSSLYPTRNGSRHQPDWSCSPHWKNVLLNLLNFIILRSFRKNLYLNIDTLLN